VKRSRDQSHELPNHLELLDDRVPVFLTKHHTSSTNCSRPYPTGSCLFGEALLDHVLRRDTGVIGPRQPLRGAAAHPLEADQHVLNDVVEGVADVQDVGDVGGGMTMTYGSAPSAG